MLVRTQEGVFRMNKDELISLGLVKSCSAIVTVQERGHMLKEFCASPTLEIGGLCSKHSPDAELTKQAEVAAKKGIALQRVKLEEEILPLATKRMMEILRNPDSRDADVIKIWQTTMDRIGLAAVSGIMLEGEIKVDAPIDILRRMLATPLPALEEFVDAEVVELPPGETL